MVEGKKGAISDKDLKKKIKDLKIELLKQPLKRKSIKKEIARALTPKIGKGDNKNNTLTKSGGKK